MYLSAGGMGWTVRMGKCRLGKGKGGLMFLMVERGWHHT